MTVKSSNEWDPVKVKKIGILRANALGDFIVTLPAIFSLRQQYPDAELVLLGKEWHKQFLEECENGYKRTPIDRVIVIPITNGLREEKGKAESPDEVNSFFKSVQQEKFDLLVSMQGKGVAAIPFLKKIGARKIIGLACDESEKPDHYFNYYYYQPEVIRNIEIVSMANASVVTLTPHLKIFDKDIQTAKLILDHLLISKKIVSIHPCGTDIRRMWTVENFAKVCDRFAELGYAVVITGSKDDNDYAEKIISTCDTSPINSCGLFSLGSLSALYRLSEVMIGIDTGPLHLAIASGAKTIGLYWGPNFINWAPLLRKDHRPVIDWNLSCPQCGIIPNDPYPFEPYLQNCNHHFSFIQNITPAQVVSAFQSFS